MANELNISIDQGADFARVLTIKDDSNVPINLTGYTFKGQAREAFGKAVEAFTFVFTPRNQGTQPGVVDWTLPASSTAAIKMTASKQYVYDVEMTSASGLKTRIIQGAITLTPEVTKI